MISDNPLAEDLDHILTHTEGLWEDIRGKRLFITGGTGFFGCWLLESFIWANNNLGLNASALVLTRNYAEFKNKAPYLAAHPAIQFHIGDIRNFNYPEGEFSHIIHAATTSSRATFHGEDPLVKFDTIVEGTRHTLDFASQCHAKKLLLTSSGAAYGKQPNGMTHVSENYCGAPDPANPNSAVGEGKRAAELLCTLYSSKYGIETKIARCFSFVGPYLPLDIHYAIGNFIQDALNGGPVRIKGDSTPYRSYLYAADLAIWLWTILFKGKSRELYNVGSEEDITIKELAQLVVKTINPGTQIEIAKQASSKDPPARYVPSVNLAKTKLNLHEWVNLDTSIQKCADWYIKNNKSMKHY